MPRFRNRPMAMLASMVVTAMAVASCGAKADSSGNGSTISKALGKAEALASNDARSGSQDPCTLLSASEAQRYVGKLSISPYRANDVHADVNGDACIYRGSNGRQLSIQPNWGGGRMMGAVLRDVPAMVGGLLGAPSTTALDTMKPGGRMGKMLGGFMKMATGASGSSATGAVTKVGFSTDTTLEGPWDNASLLHGTQLIAVKGDVSVAMELQSADFDKAKALLAAICSRL